MTHRTEARSIRMGTRSSMWCPAASRSPGSLNPMHRWSCVRAKRASCRRVNGTESTCWRELSSSISRRGPGVTIGHSEPADRRRGTREARRRRLGIGCFSILLGAAVLVGLAIWATRHSYPPMPELAGKIEHGALEHGGRTRTWIAYLPAKPATSPALVVALHGSMGTGERARGAYGYDFDLLGDRDGFIAAHPQGYEGHWNDCKVKGPYAAKRE